MRKSIRVDPNNKNNEFEQIVPKKENQVDPKCFVCKEILTQVSHLMLPEEKLFVHVEHFNCFKCKKNIADEGYFNHNQNFYCETDYYKIFEVKCFECKQNIKGEHSLVNGEKYHIDCFKCGHCKKILNEKSYKKGSKNYCGQCIKIVMKLCNKCNKEIVKDCFTSKQGSIFHKECFNCGVCNNSLANCEFITKEDIPYHVSCYKSKMSIKCNYCGNAITNKYYMVCEKSVHEECVELFKKRIGFK